MRWTFSIACMAATVAASSPQMAYAQSADEYLFTAAQVEWAVENCDGLRYDETLAMTSAFVLQRAGSAADIYRLAVKAKVEAGYTSVEAACGDLRDVVLPDG